MKVCATPLWFCRLLGSPTVVPLLSHSYQGTFVLVKGQWEFPTIIRAQLLTNTFSITGACSHFGQELSQSSHCQGIHNNYTSFPLESSTTSTTVTKWKYVQRPFDSVGSWVVPLLSHYFSPWLTFTMVCSFFQSSNWVGNQHSHRSWPILYHTFFDCLFLFCQVSILWMEVVDWGLLSFLSFSLSWFVYWFYPFIIATPVLSNFSSICLLFFCSPQGNKFIYFLWIDGSGGLGQFKIVQGRCLVENHAFYFHHECLVLALHDLVLYPWMKHIAVSLQVWGSWCTTLLAWEQSWRRLRLGNVPPGACSCFGSIITSVIWILLAVSRFTY